MTPWNCLGLFQTLLDSMGLSLGLSGADWRNPRPGPEHKLDAANGHSAPGSSDRQPQLLVALFLSSHHPALNHAASVDHQCQRRGASYGSMTDIPDSTLIV